MSVLSPDILLLTTLQLHLIFSIFANLLSYSFSFIDTIVFEIIDAIIMIIKILLNLLYLYINTMITGIIKIYRLN